MKPMRLVLFMIASIVCQALYAQNAPVPNQKSVAPDTHKLIFEKAYLHTDREQYIEGDDLWFKAYLVNAQNNQLIASSYNLYVELINPKSELVERKMVRLTAGLGKGDFKLSDSIGAGTYRLRAYTNWMRNFGDNFLFEKTVQIAPGTAKTPEASSVAVANAPQKPASSVQRPVQKPASIAFFPEGGSMIEGVNGILAFKVEMPGGKAMVASGTVVSSAGETITEFSSNALGTGQLLLQPQPGISYKATGKLSNGQSFSTPLPVAQKSGLGMYVRNADSLLVVTISTNQQTFAAQQGRELSVLCKSKGVVDYGLKVPLSQLQLRLSIPKTELNAGISVITLYDADGKPACERLVYIEGRPGANLVISTANVLNKPKGKTTVTIKCTDATNNPVQAKLSLAVTDAGMVASNQTNIFSYLMLQSEVKGTIENAARYFDAANQGRLKELDLLLLTQGWRDFVWKRLADTVLKITQEAEQGITISGVVKDLSKGRPIKGANITLNAPGAKGNKLFSAQTDTAGHYYIDAVELYGAQNIKVISRDNKNQKLGRIELDSIFKGDVPLRPIALPPDTSARAAVFATEAARRQTISKKLSLSDTINLKEVKINRSNNIFLTDQTVRKFYPDEVFKIVPEDYDAKSLQHYLSYKSSATIGEVDVDGFKYSLVYFDTGRKKIFPRLVVNGRELPYTDSADDMAIMADYQNTYMTIQMDKIEKVVIRHALGGPQTTTGAESTSLSGETLSGGASTGGFNDVYIIYITTKAGALQRKILDVAMANISGYYQARTFYAPQYAVPSTKSDLRSTIFWQPDVVTNEKGEATISYYNADPKTKVRIVAEGIAGKGIPVAATAGYEIK